MSREQQSQQSEGQVAMPLKYAQLLARSEKDKSEEENKYASDQAKLVLDGDILETRKAISEAKQNVSDLKSSKSFNPAAILEAEEELESLEKGLTKLQSLHEELF